MLFAVPMSFEILNGDWLRSWVLYDFYYMIICLLNILTNSIEWTLFKRIVCFSGRVHISLIRLVIFLNNWQTRGNWMMCWLMCFYNMFVTCLDFMILLPVIFFIIRLNEITCYELHEFSSLKYTYFIQYPMYPFYTSGLKIIST